MKEKIIEVIRQILIKIVLPFRKKKEELLGNLRFSIAFRISSNYFKLLIVYGILFMAIFCTLYMYTEIQGYNKKTDEIIRMLEINYKDEDILNPYSFQGLTFQLTDKTEQSVIYNDIDFFSDEEQRFYGGTIHYNNKGKDHILVISNQKTYWNDQKEYEVTFQYDLTESYQKMISLLWKMILLYLLIVWIIIKKGMRSDNKIFEPLRIMSATANRLTVHNLQNERLNVEGTKNELKDLASVINEMLDRIETSYESQKQFVSDASHELRTPIAVIQGYINMLNRWGTKDEEVLLESIEAIKNESLSMQDLVEKLLFLSRHDKKTLKLNKKKFNMRPVVEDMVKETKLVAHDRVIYSPTLEDVTVYGDQQSLKQAIRIFIENAIKYSRDGDIITVLCENDDGDCKITVQDTGIGMTRKDIEHIFDRFYRSDHVRNKNIEGHGLGLSLAKLIVLAHVGKIKVISQYKKGSSFIVTIPNRNYYDYEE